MKLALGLLTLVLLSGAVTVGQSTPPLFQAGQQYLVVSGCAPEYLMTVIARGLNVSPESLNPCFSEVVTVQQIRSDGWLLVTDPAGNGWTMNPASLYAFKRYQPGQAAVR